MYIKAETVALGCKNFLKQVARRALQRIDAMVWESRFSKRHMNYCFRNTQYSSYKAKLIYKEDIMKNRVEKTEGFDFQSQIKEFANDDTYSVEAQRFEKYWRNGWICYIDLLAFSESCKKATKVQLTLLYDFIELLTVRAKRLRARFTNLRIVVSLYQMNLKQLLLLLYM